MSLLQKKRYSYTNLESKMCSKNDIHTAYIHIPFNIHSIKYIEINKINWRTKELIKKPIAVIDYNKYVAAYSSSYIVRVSNTDANKSSDLRH